MELHEAQQEYRMAFLGNSVGTVVSGMLWLLSSVMSEILSVTAGIITLTVGGVFIFPLTKMVLRLTGSKTSTSKGNPLNQLAPQIAFIIPLSIPVILQATQANQNWFYPAFMIIVGAHYLPFMFLYGMWQFGLLAAVLTGGGVVTGMYLSESFSVGGWFTGGFLVMFAFAAWWITASERTTYRA